MMGYDDLKVLKSNVDKYGRLKLAREIAMSYDLLTKKLNGFSVMRPEDEDLIRKGLKNERTN